MNQSAAIVTKGLTKMYSDEMAVNGLDLEVQKGSIYGFLGLNGAGKTTTIKMLLNIVYPSSGSGRVLGLDIVEQTVQIKEKVAYVSEDPILYEYMKVSELVDFCRQTYGNWDMQLVGRYLDLFELSVGKKVKELSKGMKSQLALVLALGSGPELLILDEPTGGLDPAKTRDFFKVVLEQVAQTGQTVFFSSHRLNEVERVADTVGIIHKGKLVFNRGMDDIKLNLKKVRVVFEDDKPSGLMDQIPGIGRIMRQGRGYLIETLKDPQTVVDSLRQLHPIDIEMIDTNLEDVFMRYTGGENNVR